MTDYTTPAKVADYAGKTGAAWPSDPNERTQAIARASRYLDSLRWDGIKTDGRAQDHAWPRSGVVDRDGFTLDHQTIPPEIEEAANLLAIAEAANPGTLAPNVTPDSRVVEETIGPLSFTYDLGKSPGGAREIVTAAADLIRPFVTPGRMMLTRA
jgi:hypothetical protein